MAKYTVFYTDTMFGYEGTAQYVADNQEVVEAIFQEDFGSSANIDYIVGEQ